MDVSHIDMDHALLKSAQEIAEHLDMPLSTVQVALKDLRLAPRRLCRDIEKSGKGRPEKEYSFQRILKE